MQQHNDPKHTSNSTAEWLKNKKTKKKQESRLCSGPAVKLQKST